MDFGAKRVRASRLAVSVMRFWMLRTLSGGSCATTSVKLAARSCWHKVGRLRKGGGVKM